MTDPTLTVRSSPRIIAPDWSDRLRHTLIWLWLLILVSLGLVVLGCAMRFPAFGATVTVLIIVGGAVFAAKAWERFPRRSTTMMSSNVRPMHTHQARAVDGFVNGKLPIGGERSLVRIRPIQCCTTDAVI